MAALGGLLAMVGSIASLVGGIILLIAAFKESVGQGFLCLCIPFYILYFAFAKYESEKKSLVLAIWLGGTVISWIGQAMAAMGAAGG